MSQDIYIDGIWPRFKEPFTMDTVYDANVKARIVKSIKQIPIMCATCGSKDGMCIFDNSYICDSYMPNSSHPDFTEEFLESCRQNR